MYVKTYFSQAPFSFMLIALWKSDKYLGTFCSSQDSVHNWLAYTLQDINKSEWYIYLENYAMHNTQLVPANSSKDQ